MRLPRGPNSRDDATAEPDRQLDDRLNFEEDGTSPEGKV